MSKAKTKNWLASDKKAVQKAIAAGESCERCNCCGGDLPPYEVWEELRASGRGPDCDGTVDSSGNCRAFADVM
jgi:hypothetical protein